MLITRSAKIDWNLVAMLLVLAVAGLVAVSALLLAPNYGAPPPTIEVAAVYPGANVKAIEDAVAAPIEGQVRGVEQMAGMTSKYLDNGTYVLTITFQPGTDREMAQTLVQNRVALAVPILPDPVTRGGITVKKVMSPKKG